MKSHWSLIKNQSLIFVHDLGMVALAWFSAFWLHLDLAFVPLSKFDQALNWLPLVLIVQMGLALLMGVYRGMWRYSSLADLSRLIKAVVIGSLLLATLVSMTGHAHVVARSIVPLYGLLLMASWCGSRFLYRWYSHRSSSHQFKRVLIVGAGQAAESLVRDLLRYSELELKPVAYLDDQTKKLGQEIHGVRVVGTTQDIERFARELQIELIIIAIPSISAENMQRIVEACSLTKLPYRTLPGLNDLAEGRVSVNALREVSIEDLLGRASVDLDWFSISQGLAGKKILVTGGGGSIGSELCRQIARLGPKQLIIFENSEFNLYRMGCEFVQDFPEVNCAKELVDVADYHSMDRLMSKYKPDVIFHAAAYKHVPLLEDRILAATRNNIIGTRTVADLAVRNGVKTFVLVSTDKAVNPTNIMGMSKRLAEIYCQNLNEQSNTHFITVRFGNVLGSAGSIIPLFTQQLAMGGPLTVTHPEVTRFFMTIKEAASLILQASLMGKGGEIYVLDMGEPIKIRYLAEQMIKLAGKRVDDDIKIKYIGLRPGEKMYEELFHEREELMQTAHEKIYLAKSRSLEWGEVISAFAAIQSAYELNQEEELLTELMRLVPETQPCMATD